MILNEGYTRSPIYSTKGMCSSSQPLATAVGIKILSQGGTAADACVAMAAALNVTEPCSAGIGGDAFALYYDSKTKLVTSFEGNGTSAMDFTLDVLKSNGFSHDTKPLDPRSGMCVTVPGAALLWEDLNQVHGMLSLKQVLQPAIELAVNGVPIGPVTAKQWGTEVLQGKEAERVFKPHNRNPYPGEVFYNPDLASTFTTIADIGVKNGFYRGRIAERIIDAVKEYNGVLSLDDLESHTTGRELPISTVFKGVRVHEVSPPTHGLAALIALALIEKVKSASLDNTSSNGSSSSRGSAEEAHIGIECMRLAFADALQYVCDPKANKVPIATLLSDEYITQRAKDFNSTSSNNAIDCGDISAYLHSDTVYFNCVDAAGNGCSMINSNYQGFGVGIVPVGCGFTLHNRGHNFSLLPGHPNVAAPRKRPYHTIIPGLATREEDGSLYCVFGNMGAFMQPQGHTQLIRNMLEFGMDPQQAVDAPKWFVVGAGVKQNPCDVRTSTVMIEEGYGGRSDGGSDDSDTKVVVDRLMDKGHNVLPIVSGYNRYIYGRGQIIIRDNVTGVLTAGSDPRADGCAMPQV